MLTKKLSRLRKLLNNFLLALLYRGAIKEVMLESFKGLKLHKLPPALNSEFLIINVKILCNK